MAANLTDVARMAGVSATLVSGYVNQKKGVRMSEETRLRIENALQTLDYHPNRFARKLRTGRSHVIGVCGLSVNEVGTAERRYLAQELETRGYRMMQGSSSGDEELLKEEIHELISFGCDGLIVRLNPVSEDFARFVKSLELPVVCLTGSRVPPLLEENVITYDNASGIREAVAYLHALGHKEIALVAKYWSNFPNGPRANAFREFPGNTEEKIRSFASLEDITPRSIRKLREELPHCTAWICLNDMTALRIIQCCSELGIQIPRDLSIIGSDDCDAAKLATPALTSIHQPIEEACSAALTLLFNRLLHKKQAFDKVLSAALVRRRSCAAPAGMKL